MSDANGKLRELVERGRRAHALLAIDTGSAVRTTSLGAINTSTGAYTPTTTTVYTGSARLKRVQATEQSVGEGTRAAASLVLVLPYHATAAETLRKGDVFTFTASQDAALVGKSVTVIGPEHGTTATARRYLVEEVDA